MLDYINVEVNYNAHITVHTPSNARKCKVGHSLVQLISHKPSHYYCYASNEVNIHEMHHLMSNEGDSLFSLTKIKVGETHTILAASN